MVLSDRCRVEVNGPDSGCSNAVAVKSWPDWLQVFASDRVGFVERAMLRLRAPGQGHLGTRCGQEALNNSSNIGSSP